eukprot:1032480-Pelagomonas_calceolata.AAC.3
MLHALLHALRFALLRALRFALLHALLRALRFTLLRASCMMLAAFDMVFATCVALHIDTETQHHRGQILSVGVQKLNSIEVSFTVATKLWNLCSQTLSTALTGHPKTNSPMKLFARKAC